MYRKGIWQNNLNLWLSLGCRLDHKLFFRPLCTYIWSYQFILSFTSFIYSAIHICFIPFQFQPTYPRNIYININKPMLQCIYLSIYVCSPPPLAPWVISNPRHEKNKRVIILVLFISNSILINYHLQIEVGYNRGIKT